MDIENAQVQMRKSISEFCILHIISRGEIYASDSSTCPTIAWWLVNTSP